MSSANIMLYISGIILICYGIYSLKKIHSQKRWLPVKIDITDIKISSGEESLSPYNVVTYYFPVANYHYSYESHQYTGSRVAYDKKSIWSEDKNEIEELIKRISENRVAYINPDKPNDSVILRTLSKHRRSHYLALILSGILIIVIAAYL